MWWMTERQWILWMKRRQWIWRMQKMLFWRNKWNQLRQADSETGNEADSEWTLKLSINNYLTPWWHLAGRHHRRPHLALPLAGVGGGIAAGATPWPVPQRCRTCPPAWCSCRTEHPPSANRWSCPSSRRSAPGSGHHLCPEACMQWLSRSGTCMTIRVGDVGGVQWVIGWWHCFVYDGSNM